jgi:hypothetical protein
MARGEEHSEAEVAGAECWVHDGCVDGVLGSEAYKEKTETL